MYNNRLLKVVAVVVMLMAVATSGVAATSAGQQSYSVSTIGGSGDLTPLLQPGNTVDLSDWFQRHPSSVSRSATMSPLDNPNSQWIGPETVSAALGQQSYSVPTTGGSGDLTPLLKPGNTVDLSDWFQRHTELLEPVNARDLLDWFQRHPSSVSRSATMSPLDNPNSQWIGPETVSAALGQQSYSVPTTGGSGDLKYGPPGR
jgi:hypothetical protein